MDNLKATMEQYLGIGNWKNFHDMANLMKDNSKLIERERGFMLKVKNEIAKRI